MPRITQHTLEKAIATRHRDDMFFTEVKDGSSGRRFCRIDALAIKLSWSNPCITGYEIKVDRGDFLADNKWMGYLPMCNQLYFACPSGIIQKEEVPEQCGLVYLSANGKQLRTVKKAPYRSIEPPVDMYMYLMMKYIGPRCTYEQSIANRASALLTDTSRQAWQDYIEEKISLKQLGRSVSRKISSDLRQYERDKRELEDYKSLYKDLREQLIQLGEAVGIMYGGHFDDAYFIRSIISKIQNTANAGTVDVRKIQAAYNSLGEILDVVEKEKCNNG